jgi:2-dehydropantolactone reductase
MVKLPIPTFTLQGTNALIPALGFGSGSKHRLKKWENPNMNHETVDEDIVKILTNAINVGYRHLDGAEAYTTRLELATAVKRSGISRNEFWITDKFDSGWPAIKRPSASPSGPRESIEKGLKIFEMEYYDLFLIHSQFFHEDLLNITITEAWKQLEECYEQGLVKNIGLSNFDIEHLEEIMKIAKYKPQVLQIEYHLYLQDQTDGIFDYCKKNNIQIEAYCPLTPILENRINDDNHPLKPIIKSLSEKYNVDPNVLLLRWVYQSGVIPITTSSNIERMKQYLTIFDFEISNDDFNLMKQVGSTYKVRNMFAEHFDAKLY